MSMNNDPATQNPGQTQPGAGGINPNPAPNPYDQIQHAAITPTRFDDRMAAAMDPNQVMTMTPAPVQPAPAPESGGKVSVALAVVLGLVAVAGLAFGIWGIVSSVMANNTYENLEAKINSLQTEVTELNRNITLNLEGGAEDEERAADESTTTDTTNNSQQ